MDGKKDYHHRKDTKKNLGCVSNMFGKITKRDTNDSTRKCCNVEEITGIVRDGVGEDMNTIPKRIHVRTH
jgi:hypothetical protein